MARDPKDRCPRHAHPSLRRPVTIETVAAELGQLATRAKRGLKRGQSLNVGRLVISEEVTRGHANDNATWYGQVDPTTCNVEVADQLRWLPKANRLGVLAHELGHCIDPDGSQRDADRAIERALSHGRTAYRITYDKRWPYGGIQTLKVAE